MRVVAHHMAQLQFEKKQHEKRMQAAAHSSDKPKGPSFHEQVAKAEAEAKKNRLRNNLEKHSAKHAAHEDAELYGRVHAVTERNKPSFHEQVAIFQSLY